VGAAAGLRVGRGFDDRHVGVADESEDVSSQLRQCGDALDVRQLGDRALLVGVAGQLAPSVG